MRRRPGSRPWVHHARCAPDATSDDTIATAIGLLRELDDAAAPAEPSRDEADRTVPADGVPPHIAADFEDLARHGQAHSPVTDLLHTFRQALAEKV